MFLISSIILLSLNQLIKVNSIVANTDLISVSAIFVTTVSKDNPFYEIIADNLLYLNYKNITLLIVFCHPSPFNLPMEFLFVSLFAPPFTSFDK